MASRPELLLMPYAVRMRGAGAVRAILQQTVCLSAVAQDAPRKKDQYPMLYKKMKGRCVRGRVELMIWTRESSKPSNFTRDCDATDENANNFRPQTRPGKCDRSTDLILIDCTTRTEFHLAISLLDFI